MRLATGRALHFETVEVRLFGRVERLEIRYTVKDQRKSAGEKKLIFLAMVDGCVTYPVSSAVRHRASILSLKGDGLRRWDYGV